MDLSTLTMKKVARPAALGALGVSAGSLFLYGVIAWGSARTAGSGVDSTHSLLSWISAGIPFAAIIAVHVVYARQLFRHAREPE